MPRAEIILEGGPMHGYRVPRSEGEIPLRYPCDALAQPTPKPITFAVPDGPRVQRATYAPSGRYRVEFAHDTPIYVHQEPR